ncbi:MAG: glycogen/starch synthase [Candidatus Cloacimonadales bacterium]
MKVEKNKRMALINEEIKQHLSPTERKPGKPRILLCTPEITELPEGMGNAANLIAAKGGGLGDISAGLVRHINESQEFELHIVIPKYDLTIQDIAKITSKQMDRLAVFLSGRGIHLVNDSAFSYLKNPYSESVMHPPVRRSLVFQQHIINYLLDAIQPDVVHCNDWMTGLLPAAARAKGIKSLFTLHNIFTEKQTMMEIESSGIRPMDFMDWLYFETYPQNIRENLSEHFEKTKVDFITTGIFAADYFNTVSETFLQELKNNMYPDIVSRPIYEMIKLKCDQQRAVGIQNAPIDTMNSLQQRDIINFDRDSVMEKKAENKLLFQQRVGLPEYADKPLFFWPNRLYYQKGPDLLIDHMDYFLKKYDMQIAVVANGDSALVAQLEKFSKKYPQVAYRTFDEALSNLGKAAADFILMPSRYEPCGLPQMEALHFGTLPVVRATGGLKDTIQQMDVAHSKGNGFTFLFADREGLDYGFQEAISFYNLPYAVKKQHLQRVMDIAKNKFNLSRTAGKYMEIYRQLIREKKDGV